MIENKPSIYNGNGVYQNGGAKKHYPRMFYFGACWRIDDDVCKIAYDKGRLEMYHFTNDLNVSNIDSLYISYKFKYNTSVDLNARLLDTSRSAGRRLITTYFESNPNLITDLCYNDNGSIYKHYGGIAYINVDKEYFIEHFLDFVNNVYKVAVNGNVVINDDTINASLMKPQWFTPALGAKAGDLSYNLKNHFNLYRSGCMIKVNGVNVIPWEDLDE